MTGQPDPLVPAVEAMVGAIGPPAADAALVALARRQAAIIDGMPDAVAVAMLPQHTGQLVKVLAELELRAEKRRKASAPRRQNKVADIRVAAAAAQAGRRKRAG